MDHKVGKMAFWMSFGLLVPIGLYVVLMLTTGEKTPEEKAVDNVKSFLTTVKMGLVENAFKVLDSEVQSATGFKGFSDAMRDREAFAAYEEFVAGEISDPLVVRGTLLAGEVEHDLEVRFMDDGRHIQGITLDGNELLRR